MLGNLITCTSNYEASSSRDIKRILTITSRSHYINVAITIEDGRNSCRQDTITKSQQLIHCNTAHLQTREQGCYLFFGELTLRYTYDDILGLFAGKFLMIQHSVQNVLHFHKFCLLYFGLLSFGLPPSTCTDLKEKRPVASYGRPLLSLYGTSYPHTAVRLTTVSILRYATTMLL